MSKELNVDIGSHLRFGNSIYEPDKNRPTSMEELTKTSEFQSEVDEINHVVDETQKAYMLQAESSQNRNWWFHHQNSLNVLLGNSAILTNDLAKIETGEVVLTSKEHDIISAAKIANEVKIYESFEEMRRRALKEGFNEKALQYLEAAMFFGYPDILGKIGPHNLLELIQGHDNNGNQINLEDILNFFTQARVIGATENYDKFDEFKSPLSDNYPLLSRTFSYNAIFAANSILIESQDPDRNTNVSRFFKSVNQKAVGDQTLKILNKFHSDFRKISQILRNPENEQFPPLERAINSILNEGKLSQIVLITVLGSINTIELYREFENGSKSYDNETFNKFNDVVKEFIELSDGQMNLYTLDDISLFIDQTREAENDHIPTIENFKKSISDLIMTTRTRRFEIEGSDISLGNMVEPNLITIDMDENRPTMLSLSFEFSNEDEKESTIKIFIDTTKGILDWNFIESLDNPDSYAAKKAFFESSLNAILKAKEVAEEVRNKNKSAKHTNSQAKPTKLIKSTPISVPVPESKKRKRNSSQAINDTPIQQIILNESKDIRKNVIVPSPEDYDRMTRSITPEDKSIILNSLNNFNEGGSGNIKMLGATLPDGSRQYSMRINASSGSVRLILRENESPISGERNFSIQAVGYRKDIYRKRGI